MEVSVIRVQIKFLVGRGLGLQLGSILCVVQAEAADCATRHTDSFTGTVTAQVFGTGRHRICEHEVLYLPKYECNHVYSATISVDSSPRDDDSVA